MPAFGSGSTFVGYLPPESCDNCHNTKHKHIKSTYTSSSILGLTEYNYTGIAVVCPICEDGHLLNFPPFKQNSIVLRWLDTKKTKQESIG